MKQFIKTLLGFLVCASLLYVVYICLWGEFVPKGFQKNLQYLLGTGGHMNTRLKEVKKAGQVDLLFLGSSHAYRGFDTRMFKAKGIAVFNLGSSSQTPLQTRVLLNRYLKNLKPARVIIEVYPMTFTMDGIESSLDLISNDKNDGSSVKMAFKQNHIKVYNTLIYALYRDVFHRNDSFVEPIIKGQDTYVRGGYVEREKHFYKHIDQGSNKWEFNPSQFSEFKALLDDLKALSIQVILVQAPITKNLYKSYSNNKEFDKTMASYGEYYNFNEMLLLDDSLHFYDSNHMNQFGVEKFNKKLIEEILTN